MLNQRIGENAGKIWTLLYASNELSLKSLIEQTGLSENDLHMSLGWLARENKILFYEKDKELKICIVF